MALSVEGPQAVSHLESTDDTTHQCNLQVLDDASDDWVSLMLGDSDFDLGVLGSPASFPLPDLEDFELTDLDCPGMIPSACCHTSSDSPGACFDDILCSFEEENAATESKQDVPFESKEVSQEGCPSSVSHDCATPCHPSILPPDVWGVDSASMSSGFPSAPNSSQISDFCVQGTNPSGVATFSPSPESGLTQGSCEFQDGDVNIAIIQEDVSGSEEDNLYFLVSDICSEGTGSTEIENGSSSVSMVPEFRDSATEVQDGLGDGTLCRQFEMDARQAVNGQQQFPCGSDNGAKTTVSGKVSKKRKAVDRKSRSGTPEETVVDSIERCKDGDESNGIGEDGEKRQARLMRNRESAQLSRQRKKIYVDELEEKIKTMASTITELNNTINLISTENINLRRQLGFFCPPPSQPGGIPVTAPWVGTYHGGPVVGGRFMVAGSQVPLVPIPRWRSQQTTVKKTKKSKSESHEKGPEAKASKRTKKVAGVALIGFIFFIFTLLPPNINFLHLKPIVREEVNVWDTRTWHSHSGDILTRAGGRVLTGISEEDNPRQDKPRTKWASLGTSKSEIVAKDSQTTVPEDWQALTECETGHKDNREHNGHKYETNGSVPLAATLFVPRNDGLVRVEGNLIIHSILAGDKAAGEFINMHQQREELKWKGVRTQEREDKGQALDANLKALAVKVTTEEKGALVELQKALAAKSRSDHDEEGMHSEQEDGSLQQWFIEGLAGPVFSSGMCTELFQFETSVARSTPSSAAASHGREMNDLVENSTVKLQEHGPRKAGRWISSVRKDIPYAVPLPPTGHKVTFDGSSKRRNLTGSSERIKTEELKNQKYPRSSIVVSVLAGSEFGDQARSPGGLKGRPQIFVVVLVDSVKYVTYSCLLPFEKADELQGGYNL